MANSSTRINLSHHLYGCAVSIARKCPWGATVLKIRVDRVVKNIAAYIMLGITLDGKKEIGITHSNITYQNNFEARTFKA